MEKEKIQSLIFELLESEQITQEEIEAALGILIEKQESGYGGKPRRKPTLVRMFLDFFKKTKYKRVSRFSEIVELFKIKDYSFPEQSASSKINQINTALEEVGIDLEIHKETVVYFRRRPKN